jgi:hypothetical protein
MVEFFLSVAFIAPLENPWMEVNLPAWMVVRRDNYIG